MFGSPQNYAQNMSYYRVHMCALEDENTAAYKYFKQGGNSGLLTGKLHFKVPFN